MRKLITSSLVLASLAAPVLASAPSAHAAGPEPVALAPTRYDAHFSAGDWAGALLSGDAAGAAGGALGGALGYAMAGSCVDDPDDESFFGSCFLHGVGEAALGAAVGSTFGGAAGVYAYGQLSGHSGSYWAAAGGWALGLVASAGLFAATADTASEGALGTVSLFILPALGATAGYVLTLDDGGPAVAPTGALLEVDHGVRVTIPSVSVSLGADHRIERVDVPLVGGRF